MEGSSIVQGGADRKERGFMAGGEEQPLLAALRHFVKVSGLRVPRIAQLMGVGETTLAKWLSGKARPSPKKLIEIKSFLGWHAPESLTNSEPDVSASF
jgi:transcriptional regulator with XRE-family HTH domain